MGEWGGGGKKKKKKKTLPFFWPWRTFLPSKPVPRSPWVADPSRPVGLRGASGGRPSVEPPAARRRRRARARARARADPPQVLGREGASGRPGPDRRRAAVHGAGSPVGPAAGRSGPGRAPCAHRRAQSLRSGRAWAHRSCPRPSRARLSRALSSRGLTHRSRAVGLPCSPPLQARFGARARPRLGARPARHPLAVPLRRPRPSRRALASGDAGAADELAQLVAEP